MNATSDYEFIHSLKELAVSISIFRAHFSSSLDLFRYGRSYLWISPFLATCVHARLRTLSYMTHYVHQASMSVAPSVQGRALNRAWMDGK